MIKIKNIEKLRRKVDIIDHELISLLAERFEVTKEIIFLKKKNGIAVKDEGREGAILEKAKELAKKLKISPGFITDIFDKILEESKKQ